MKRVRREKIHLKDGCGGFRDRHSNEFDCEHKPPFTCEECVYFPENVKKRRGKNPQAKK